MIWRKAEPTTTNRKKPSSSGPTVVAFLSLCGAHASSEHGASSLKLSGAAAVARAEPSGQRAHHLALGGVSATLQDVRVELLLRLLHPPLRRARLQNSGRSASGVRTQRLLLCAKQSNRGGAPFRRRAGELLGDGLVHLRPDSSSAAQLPRARLEEGSGTAQAAAYRQPAEAKLAVESFPPPCRGWRALAARAQAGWRENEQTDGSGNQSTHLSV